MADAPAGPFDRWAIAERLAWLAGDMFNEDDTGDVQPLNEDLVVVSRDIVDEWASQLTTIADEIRAQETVHRQAYAACGVVDHRFSHVQPCDRPSRHRGMHTWEIQNYIRKVRAYDDLVVEANRMRRVLSFTQRKNRQLQARVTEMENRRRFFRRRPKPDRG